MSHGVNTNMSAEAAKRERLFVIFKYSIYTLVFFNLIYFLQEDFFASGHTFRDGVNLKDIAGAFAASVDTFAWFILMIVFELETYTLEDEDITPPIRWSIDITKLVCYVLIIIAATGYFEKFQMIYAFEPSTIQNACSQVGTILSSAEYLDDYYALTAENCAALNAPYWVNESTSMIVPEEMNSLLRKLATLDVVNSNAWILIVAILQIDVMLQIRGKLTPRIYQATVIMKTVLYSTLLVAAGYWGYLQDPMGTWDAFLWILAFFFIELNLFKWTEEEANATVELAEKAS